MAGAHSKRDFGKLSGCDRVMASIGLAQASSNDTRVMVVDDSAVVRGMVKRWLEARPGIKVVNSAENGKAAIDMVAVERPDIVVLDIEMPVMDGLTALPSILRNAPGARVLISSTLSRRNAEVSLKALSLGATDYICKPSFARDGQDARNTFQEELVRKVVGLAPSRGRSSKIGAQDTEGWMAIPDVGTRFHFRKSSLYQPQVLTIGSSTGGPAALTTVFEAAKGAFKDVPVLVAQHMPATFTALLGDKLARIAGLEGGEAKDGERVLPGHLYVAPGGRHMRVTRGISGPVIALNDKPPINHCRPAVDPLFDSLADVYGHGVLAAVLTGMGSDGANGALKIADAGGTVFAQDEASSVVWGMPGAVAGVGAASALLSIDAIGPRLVKSIMQGVRK